MSLTLESTIGDLLDELTVRDSVHTRETPVLVDFGQTGVQLNWSDDSKVRIVVTTMSMTQNGVRSRPTVDLTDLPGGYNPNNPASEEIPPGPLENEIVPVRIPYAGPPEKNTAIFEAYGNNSGTS